MITREELKKELDRLPESLVEEVYTLLKRLTQQKRGNLEGNSWNRWKQNLDKFTPDFMVDRDQSANQIRESLDS